MAETKVFPNQLEYNSITIPVLVKTTSGALTRLASPTSNGISGSVTYVSSGVGFSYTPIASGNRIKVILQVPYGVTFSGATGSIRTAFHRVYSDTTLVPNLSASIPGTSTQIGINENVTGGCFNDGSSNYYNRGTLYKTFEYTYASSAIQYFYIGMRSEATSCDQTFQVSTSTYGATYTVEEYSL